MGKVFSPEEVSAIDPKLREELNISVAGSEGPKPTVDEDIADIPPELIAKAEAIIGKTTTETPGGFSWAGLVYGPIYYWAMKDSLFGIVSLLACLFLYTFPLLIPMAFFARKRAWEHKKWANEDEFWRVQKSWDRSAIVLGVITLIALIFISKYILSMLSSAFGTTDPTQILQQLKGLSQ